jgi:two-component system chemotaxis sensor kinase CheA
VTQDRYKYFRVEAREILDQLGQGALDLEKGAAAPGSVGRLLRLAHTLKGAARVVKQREIAECAHALEDALAPFRDGADPVTRDRIDRVFSLVDDIGKSLAQLSVQPSSVETSGPELVSQPLAGFRPAMDDLDALLGGVFEAHVRSRALRPRLAQLERARDAAALMVDELNRPRNAEAARAGSHIPHDKTRSAAEHLRAMLGALERDFTADVDQLDRELRQVREGAERLRLVPVSSIFMFLERAVRDVAKELGKRVRFEASGGEVRVDAVLLNVVQGALLHIVRNGVAHGIEGGDSERRSAGKAVDGHVKLRVSQRGPFVSFACSDDGRGIDLDAVRRSAQRRGRLSITESVTTARDELLGLIFEAGISTAATVTDVSGRGIGLDVVREAAERLGGEATARTEKGQGTTIELIVPLSVASFRALVIEVGNETVAIPLDAVRSTVRVKREEIVRTGPHETILSGGQAIPLRSLRQTVSPASSSAPWLPCSSAIVVHAKRGVAAFTADRILGAVDVVMRPLPEFAPATTMVVGVTLDAAGDPQLILDPDGLVAAAQRPTAFTTDASAPRLRILVVDDTLTTRMLEQSILESAGYEVELATSGEEALDKARAAHFALFLVDVEMPGMGGFAFIERVRADAHLQHTPSILVTSRNEAADRQRGRDVGAQAYIVKGEFDQRVLLERIHTLVG